jgi:phosphatidylglycerophosphatase A
MTRSAAVLATWFGCGLFPVAPGTVASLAALGIAWGLHGALGWRPSSFAVLALALLGPAIWAAGVTARQSGSLDPGKVVIDEVVGQWVALAGAIELDWKSWLAAFLLFRAFDIGKPFPVRQLERLHGGSGIVADDVGAGLYAALVLYAIGWIRQY